MQYFYHLSVVLFILLYAVCKFGFNYAAVRFGCK